MDNLPKLFRIGEMAKLFNLSVSSIRHYEDMGLLTPERIDPETGYRYYSTRQFEAFNAIRYLRALGMPLESIADFLQNRDIDKIEEKLSVQRQAVVEKQQELERIKRKIDARLDQLRDAKSSRLDVIECVSAPERRLFWMERKLKIKEYHDMELPTIGLAKSQAEAVIFLGKVGVSISAEHLRDGVFDQYDGIFLVLDEADKFDKDVTIIPGGKCVRIRFCGSHREAPEYYRRLLDHIRSSGLEISGFSREITMIDYGITSNTDEFVTEISIPVIKK